MKNPWESIRLADYESHMGLDSVGQLQAMNRMMEQQLTAYGTDTAMLLGAAGCNGLEHVTRETYRRVYAVDINDAYLQAVEARYAHLTGVLVCLCLDLTRQADDLPRAALVIANLLIEYIGYPAFCRVLEAVRPEYVSCVIQVNGESVDGTWVSDSPYLHVFDGLEAIHHQIDEAGLRAALGEAGYRPILRAAEGLPNGKSLLRLDFRREG